MAYNVKSQPQGNTYGSLKNRLYVWRFLVVWFATVAQIRDYSSESQSVISRSAALVLWGMGLGWTVRSYSVLLNLKFQSHGRKYAFHQSPLGDSGAL